MEYTNLGRSGLEVSRFALGSAMFGTRITGRAVDRLVDEFVDMGGNLIDSANVYGRGMIAGDPTLGGGAAEMALRPALRRHRDRVVVATKGYWLAEPELGPNTVGLSKTYLLKNVDASLKRLGVDYIDLFQCHVWDFYTPIEETLSTLDSLVRAGKIRYVGASNWEGWHVVKANSVAANLGTMPIISNQVWYCLVDRTVEHSIVPASRDQGVGVIAWGALAQGFLSGRYRRGATHPDAGSRNDTVLPTEPSSWAMLANEANWAILDATAAIARSHRVDPGVIAIRWLIDGGQSDVVLVGGSTVEQVKSLMGAANIALSRDEADELTRISTPVAPYPTSFYDLFCYRDSPYYGGHRVDSQPIPATGLIA